MNYAKIYNTLISKAIPRVLQGYTEKHHIMPRCLGGTDVAENIVVLTAKEHYFVHLLLTKIYPENDSLVYALWAMCGTGKYKTSSRTYEEVKLKMSEVTKRRLKIHNPWQGKKHKPESIEKQKLSALTRKTTSINEKKRREGISKNNKGKKKSMEHTENIRKAKQGSKNPMFGKKWKIVDGKRVIYIP